MGRREEGGGSRLLLSVKILFFLVIFKCLQW